MKDKCLAIGLMSGTSMDGIDAALIETDGEFHVVSLGYSALAYDPSMRILLKGAEYTVRKCQGDMVKASARYLQGLRAYLTELLKVPPGELDARMADLAGYLGEVISLERVIAHSTALHAQVVRQLLAETDRDASNIDVVGYHGQTLYHRPAEKISVIVGDADALSAALCIGVVSDFRRADVMAGGQGAPLAPLYHRALAVRDQRLPLAVVNCGGIANVTLIPHAEILDVVAFDTGPGNVLIDQFVGQRTGGAECMDKDGRYGLQGEVNPAVLAALYENVMVAAQRDYFDQRPPKSLDYGDMQLIAELDQLSLADGCATLAAFTADTIVQSLSLVDMATPRQWVLAGGGWKHPVICREFSSRLVDVLDDEVVIDQADEFGWLSQAIEAETFAYLAVRCLQKKPISMPKTTGVSVPLCGAVISNTWCRA